MKEAPPWDVEDCSFRSEYLFNSLENLFRKDLPNFNKDSDSGVLVSLDNLSNLVTILFISV